MSSRHVGAYRTGQSIRVLIAVLILPGATLFMQILYLSVGGLVGYPPVDPLFLLPRLFCALLL